MFTSFIAENLRAVSHFKHGTFSVLQYANYLKGVKRTTKWETSSFAHPASYYPVPLTRMPLGGAKFMTSLPAESIPKEAEIIMKEWAEHY